MYIGLIIRIQYVQTAPCMYSNSNMYIYRTMVSVFPRERETTKIVATIIQNSMKMNYMTDYTTEERESGEKMHGESIDFLLV